MVALRQVTILKYGHQRNSINYCSLKHLAEVLLRNCSTAKQSKNCSTSKSQLPARRPCSPSKRSGANPIRIAFAGDAAADFRSIREIPRACSRVSSMGPPSEDSQNRRPSRRPPRFSPGPTQKASPSGVRPRNKSVPPPPSPIEDDVVGRVRHAFRNTVPKLLQLPEADFALPPSVVKLKMSSKQRAKTRPAPEESPEDTKTPRRGRKSDASPRGKKPAAFPTPKLPGETSGEAEEVVYSPAAKRPRIMPKKYRDEPDPPVRPRKKRGSNVVREEEPVVYGNNPFGTKTCYVDNQGPSTSSVRIPAKIHIPDQSDSAPKTEVANWSDSDSEGLESKLNAYPKQKGEVKSMFLTSQEETSTESSKVTRTPGGRSTIEETPSTSEMSDTGMFKTPELPGPKSGLRIVSPAGVRNTESKASGYSEPARRSRRQTRSARAESVASSPIVEEGPMVSTRRRSRLSSESSKPVTRSSRIGSERQPQQETVRGGRRSRAQSVLPVAANDASEQIPEVGKPSPERGRQTRGSSSSVKAEATGSLAPVTPEVGPKSSTEPSSSQRTTRRSTKGSSFEYVELKPATRRSRGKAALPEVSASEDEQPVAISPAPEAAPPSTESLSQNGLSVEPKVEASSSKVRTVFRVASSEELKSTLGAKEYSSPKEEGSRSTKDAEHSSMDTCRSDPASVFEASDPETDGTDVDATQADPPTSQASDSVQTQLERPSKAAPFESSVIDTEQEAQADIAEVEEPQEVVDTVADVIPALGKAPLDQSVDSSVAGPSIENSNDLPNPIETGPPIPFKGQTRAQYRASMPPFVPDPCDVECTASLRDVYIQPDEEDFFLQQVSEDPLPFELDEGPSTSKGKATSRRTSRTSKKDALSPKKDTPTRKDKKEQDSPQPETSSKAPPAPPSKPPRKAPTAIMPKKPTRRSAVKKEEYEEVPVEGEKEEAPVKTPRGRGGRKSVAASTPIKAEEDFRTPEPVVQREPTPAASGSGRPQRQRKIPAKFSEDVMLETAVLNNSVPELRRENKGRQTRTPRRSFSTAADEPRKPRRKSICVPEPAKEEPVPPPPAPPQEETVPEPVPVKEKEALPEEPEVKPDETPKDAPIPKDEPAVKDEPAPSDAPAPKESSEAVVEEPVEDPKPEEISSADSEDSTKASSPIESEETESSSVAPESVTMEPIKPDIVPVTVEIPKMDDIIPVQSTPTSVAPPPASIGSGVRSSGRVRKKPPERDFFPGEPRRKSHQKVSESDDFDIDPDLMAQILSHTEKLEKTICSPKGAGTVPEPAVESVLPQPPRGGKRKRTESDISAEAPVPPVQEAKPKPKKVVKKPSEAVFKTPLAPKPRVARKSSSLDSPMPVELKLELPSTPSTPMSFPVALSGPQLEVKNYNEPCEFFKVANWTNTEYSDYLEYIEERQRANTQSVGLGFLRETLPATEDFFYREVLRSGGGLERVDSSPMKRSKVDRSDIDVCATEELPQEDLMTADPAERIAKDIVEHLPRPKKEGVVAEEGQEVEEDDLEWNIEDAKALAKKQENPRFARLLADVINVTSSQFVSFVSSFGIAGGPAIYYSHSVENGRRLGNLLHRCIGDEKNFLNAIHEWMIRHLPLEFLARYLDVVRFMAEANRQSDLFMHMMSIGTDVTVNSCHNWVLEFTLAQTADPHTDLVKHSLKTVQLHEVVFVIVDPNLTKVPTTKSHVAMFRDLLPGIADHVDVKLNVPDDLTHNYEIVCYCVDAVIQEVEETVQRYPNHHVVVAAWGVACRIVQKALQEVGGVTATLMFAYPNEAIAADPDDEANLTYCPSLFIAGENTCSNYIERLQTTRSLMIADTGLVVVANADRNLLVSATRLGIERLSQRTVDRAIVEHVYDFLKLVMKQANSNMRQHRKEMAPLDMAGFMRASNTTIEDQKIKKTLFQSPSTARSSASRHKV
uniref:Protein kinase domain-containing protein n=1 Tax=Steinernema glaseri TaxID=37863 RepID=A0A1I7YMH9_9BILA